MSAALPMEDVLTTVPIALAVTNAPAGLVMILTSTIMDAMVKAIVAVFRLS